MSGGSYAQALEARERLRHRIDHDDDVKAVVDRVRRGLKVSNHPRLAEVWGRSGLIDSEVMAWSSDMSGLLQAIAPSMPEWTLRPEALPSERGFLHFAQSLELPPYADGLKTVLRYIGYQPSDLVPNGLSLSFWCEAVNGPTRARYVCIPLQEVLWPWRSTAGEMIAALANEHDDAACTDLARFFAAAMALMEQSIVVRQSEAAPRSTRRRLGEVGETPIHVVKLRRSERDAHHGTDGEPVEWSCQWVVRGHWKQQTYGPKGGLRKPIFILPHIKGPDDKPLKADAERVFVVDR